MVSTTSWGSIYRNAIFPITVLSSGLRRRGLAVHTVDDINPALPERPSAIGIMVYSLSIIWVMQELYHQPYLWKTIP